MYLFRFFCLFGYDWNKEPRSIASQILFTNSKAISICGIFWFILIKDFWGLEFLNLQKPWFDFQSLNYSSYDRWFVSKVVYFPAKCSILSPSLCEHHFTLYKQYLSFETGFTFVLHLDKGFICNVHF